MHWVTTKCEEEEKKNVFIQTQTKKKWTEQRRISLYDDCEIYYFDRMMKLRKKKIENLCSSPLFAKLSP